MCYFCCRKNCIWVKKTKENKKNQQIITKKLLIFFWEKLKIQSYMLLFYTQTYQLTWFSSNYPPLFSMWLLLIMSLCVLTWYADQKVAVLIVLRTLYLEHNFNFFVSIFYHFDLMKYLFKIFLSVQAMTRIFFVSITW